MSARPFYFGVVGILDGTCLSPPREPEDGNEIVIKLPNNIRYKRSFNRNDRVGDLLNYIRQIARLNNITINQLNFRNRNGLICDYNNSLIEAGIDDGTYIALQ